jgi:hypothetical protein
LGLRGLGSKDLQGVEDIPPVLYGLKTKGTKDKEQGEGRGPRYNHLSRLDGRI